jgi:hypothetical protein
VAAVGVTVKEGPVEFVEIDLLAVHLPSLELAQGLLGN